MTNRGPSHAPVDPERRDEFTAVPLKRQPPTESWWATARTREEFNQKLQERTQASGSAFGPVP